MATRIRLQRHGKKGKPFFHLVAADSRAKRDGKFIEKLGTYNPTANPAVIDINFDATLTWVQNGAEMSDTARAILSYKGAMMLHHLHGGVNKGAFSLEEADAKFAKWQADKDAKIQSKKDTLATAKAKSASERLEAEANASTEEISETPVATDETAAVENTDAAADAPETTENTEA